MKYLLLLITCFVSLWTLAQDTGTTDKNRKNELAIQVKSTLDANKADYRTMGQYTTCRNTMAHSLELNYTRILGKHFFACLSIEGGYDKYRFQLNYPFDARDKFNLRQGTNGTVNEKIFYSKLNVGVGYHFRPVGRLVPELKIIQAIQHSLNSKNIYSELDQYPSGYSYGRIGYLGNADDRVRSVELLTPYMQVSVMN